ncbi:class II histone deacetylase [Pseudomonas sp. Fl4BN1]|uniref:class II histone deacetylase n=1 Tax=Pseudomonas sp. Fl4BN1 TaxID=2697651 RepID=UPI0013768108|nr:class II histone deacetylase [Pseudomonas sp. Fl4BN1]NBF09181.1 class II histone deacetylase [Pseudomonas sp. Fl4BN1]
MNPEQPLSKGASAFLFDERCLWFHSGQASALAAPVGGWVQPLASGSGVASADCLRRLKSLMDASGLSAQLRIQSARPASLMEMARVHDRQYLERFQHMSANGGGELGLAAPFGPGGFELAALSAGLAREAVSGVMGGEYQRAYAACIPAGHHALRDQAMGSTLLANSAIAVEHAIVELGARRVAIVDWDVHHGNGTQSLFYERDDVFTVSLHQENCFPPGSGGADERGSGEGLGANLNIALLPGCGHAQYLHAMEQLVVPALLRFAPDLLVIGSGYDASTYDVLGHMQLHSGTFREMTRLMVEVAERLGHGRLVMIHEGGYSDVYVPFCAIAAIEALTGLSTDVRDPFIDFIQQQCLPEDFDCLHRQRVRLQAQQLGLTPFS